jgi:hypothetical protein
MHRAKDAPGAGSAVPENGDALADGVGQRVKSQEQSGERNYPPETGPRASDAVDLAPDPANTADDSLRALLAAEAMCAAARATGWDLWPRADGKPECGPALAAAVEIARVLGVPASFEPLAPTSEALLDVLAWLMRRDMQRSLRAMRAAIKRTALGLAGSLTDAEAQAAVLRLGGFPSLVEYGKALHGGAQAKRRGTYRVVGAKPSLRKPLPQMRPHQYAALAAWRILTNRKVGKLAKAVAHTHAAPGQRDTTAKQPLGGAR